MDPIGSYAPDDTRKILRFNYAGAAGWDLVCSWFLSEYRFARRIAWKLTRKGGMYAGLDVSKTRLVVQMPCGSYEVAGYDRDQIVIKPCSGVSFGGL